MQRKNFIQDETFPRCPIRNVLARIADKWSLVVLYTLEQNGTMRFKAMQRSIPDISEKMLATTLRTMEEDGFLTRTVYPEVPPRVEYSLTPRAISLLPHINALIAWAATNMDDIIHDRRQHQQ